MKDSHSDEEVSDVDVEKTNVGSHLELVESDEEIPDPDAGKSDEERARIDRRLLWRLDMKLLPWLCLLYLLSYLDRTNIGNARLAGLEADLNMTGSQYNSALTIFFVSYAVAEPATNVLLKRLTPRIFITSIMILWGLVMTLMGLVTNHQGLLAARFFLGLAEAGLFPGVNFYLSCWYKRSEFGIRAAIFFSSAALAGSFGGLLAAAIAKMNGIGGLSGWQWIFILEGLATIVIGVVCVWMVHDFPDTATFLSTEDRQRVLRRLEADSQSSSRHEDFSWKPIKDSLTDWKTYGYMVIYMGCLCPLYAFSLFLPTIVSGMGYTNTRAQLLSVPPYAVAACVTIFVGWFADRTRWRGYSNIAVVLSGIVGFSMLLASQNPHIQYAGTFLGAIGIYPTIANTISWISNNVEGVYKRGITIGTAVGWGNLNGVVSSNIYIKAERPRFTTGHSVILAYQIVCLLGGSVVMHLALRWENAKRRRGERDYLVEGKTREEIEALGDRRPDFLYTL